MARRLLGGFSAILFLVVPSLADFSGRVTGVTDGDTLRVLRDGVEERIRLADIDCPERRQPFGAAAKRYAAAETFGRVVTVRERKRDRYGRLVGTVVLPDGRSLNRELVRAGLAWWYERYSADPALAAVEREARVARRGLWADDAPRAPWEYRRRRGL